MKPFRSPIFLAGLTLIGVLALLLFVSCSSISIKQEQPKVSSQLVLLVEDETEGWKSKEALKLEYTDESLTVSQGSEIDKIPDGEHGAMLVSPDNNGRNDRPCAVNVFTTSMGKKVIQLAMGQGIYQFHCYQGKCYLYAYGTLKQVNPESKFDFGQFLNK